MNRIDMKIASIVKEAKFNSFEIINPMIAYETVITVLDYRVVVLSSAIK